MVYPATATIAATMPAPEPIRVWLEPGYDHGRTGAWMLDWPGCFTWGATREIALARVPSAVGRHALWLASFGEPAVRPASDEVAVVEEVAAERDGAYERNATFRADRRPVDGDELETMLRQLDFARADLLRLVERLDAESEGATLPIEARDAAALQSGARAGRGAAEVLAHIANAEIWLASRLDRSARYEGPGRDSELGTYLVETRRWAVDRLRGYQARDPALEGVDGKGESWTLAKVLRRFLYHSLDHLEELDRRLALATHAADRLAIRRNATLDLDDVAELLAWSGFRRRLGDRERLRRMVEGSTETWTAWDGDRLVAFGRVLTDGAFNAYVSTVAVHPRWQDRRVGRRLMEALMEGRDDLTFILQARPGVDGFYERLGFSFTPIAMTRRRLR